LAALNKNYLIAKANGKRRGMLKGGGGGIMHDPFFDGLTRLLQSRKEN
jgi:hypothetical protein